MDAKVLDALKEALRSKLQEASKSIRFPGADLTGAALPGAELGAAEFQRAVFNRASLVGANFTKANLEGASFVGADLGAADFTEAYMVGVDLSNSQLDDAILSNADLRGAFLRNLQGEPLSLAGARIDKKAIARSSLSEAEVNQLMGRGVIVEEPESVPSFSMELMSLSPPSFVTILHVHESESRHVLLSEAPEAPRSSRKMANFLTQLVEDARLDQGIPKSLRHISLPPVSLGEIMESASPEVGATFMGVRIERELPRASVARTFVGTNDDGTRVIVKVFDPLRQGAALHLPAFQRGLRAMNRVQVAGIDSLRVMPLLAVAPDLTSYVAPFFGDGALDQIVSVDITMDAGLLLFEQVCASVALVHQLGVLVRSIKPSNILLEGLSPYLTEIDMIDLPTLQECSANAGGYAAYAAPEELNRTGTRSPSADVFALGKLLEYLLTGQDPLSSLTGQSALQTREQIPAFLVNLVTHCTAPDPADRFQQVQEILDELARFRSEGSGARLKAPMRATTLSRVSTSPSLLPAERKAIYGQPMVIPEGDWEQDSTDQPWIARGLEMGVALLGLMAVVFVAAMLWTSPSNVDFVEKVWTVACVLAGFSVWLIPPPKRKLRAFRLASWAAVGVALYLIGPMPLVRARWTQDLSSNDLAKKERAVSNLIRSGHRNISNKNLDGVRLVAQDLSSTRFTGSSLRRADLSRSLLRESVFDNANLEDANVSGADLRLSKLDAVRGLRSLKCDAETKFPDGFRCGRGLARPMKQ